MPAHKHPIEVVSPMLAAYLARLSAESASTGSETEMVMRLGRMLGLESFAATAIATRVEAAPIVALQWPPVVPANLAEDFLEHVNLLQPSRSEVHANPSFEGKPPEWRAQGTTTTADEKRLSCVHTFGNGVTRDGAGIGQPEPPAGSGSQGFWHVGRCLESARIALGCDMNDETDDEDRRAVVGELLLLPEVAAMTRLSEDTIRWLRHKGTGPRSGRLGRRVVYRRSDVQAWIDAGFEGSPSTASGGV